MSDPQPLKNIAAVNTPVSVEPSPFHFRSTEWSGANDWTTVNGVSLARVYSDPLNEYDALRHSVGLIDRSARLTYVLRGRHANTYINRLFAVDAAGVVDGQFVVGPLCDKEAQMCCTSVKQEIS